MKCHALMLAVLAIFVLVCPSCARYSQGGPQRRPGRDVEVQQPSEYEKNIIQMRAFQTVMEEMGADADEDERLKRVEEITDRCLREEFPDMFKPSKAKKKHSESDDIWENGTVVRYMARVIAGLLAVGALFAFKEQILGRETMDGRKIRPAENTRKNR